MRTAGYCDKPSHENVPSETQETIVAWADATFGVARYEAAAKRAVQEIREFLEAIEEDRRADALSETPDIVITLYRLCSVCGQDLLDAVDRKMVINRAREWVSNGDGTGQHVRKPDEER